MLFLAETNLKLQENVTKKTTVECRPQKKVHPVPVQNTV